MNYVDFLSSEGDPTEIKGVTDYKLGEKFPRYAEFWVKYVAPNREPDQTQKHKLRNGFPIDIEEIFNTHYSVFFQLTFAYNQIEYLSSVGTDGVVDIGSPLFHLGTAIDLIERLFVAVFRRSNPDLIKPLNRVEFIEEGAKCWDKYPDFFKEFSDTYRNVSFNFHSVTTLFNDTVPHSKGKKAFNRIQAKIRPYRNKLIHGVSPLRLMKDNKIYIPKEDNLSNYVSGRWSSQRDDINIDKYEPAVELMGRFADDLVNSANELWELLIKEIATHVPMPENYIKFQELSKAEPYQNSISTSASGIAGTLTTYAPPTKPSGINYIGGDSDGDPLS